MKPAHSFKAESEAPVRVEFQVQFTGGSKNRRRVEEETTSTASAERESLGSPAISPAPQPTKRASLARIPKITRLLVLGHHFEELVREGVVRDYAEIAHLTALSRARVTQITNLTLLAPDIQQAIMDLSPIRNGQDLLAERALRCLTAQPDWKLQRRILNSLSGDAILLKTSFSSSDALPSHRPRG